MDEKIPKISYLCTKDGIERKRITDVAPADENVLITKNTAITTTKIMKLMGNDKKEYTNRELIAQDKERVEYLEWHGNMFIKNAKGVAYKREPNKIKPYLKECIKQIVEPIKTYKGKIDNNTAEVTGVEFGMRPDKNMPFIIWFTPDSGFTYDPKDNGIIEDISTLSLPNSV